MTTESRSFSWLNVVQSGALAGVVVLFLGLVGLIEPFLKRTFVEGVSSSGRAMVLGIIVTFAYMSASRNAAGRRPLALLAGAVTGVMAGLLLALYLLLASQVNLRAIFANASPVLHAEFGLGQLTLGGSIMLVLAAGAASGLAGGILFVLPALWRKPIVYSLLTIFLMSLLEDRLRTGPLGHPGFPTALRGFLFGRAGMNLRGALVTFGVVSGLNLLWNWQGSNLKKRIAAGPPAVRTGVRWMLLALAALVLLTLPITLQKGLTEIAVIVGYFALMGLGLNVVVGFAGLLDLGYVAFFAIGAYTMGLLTSVGEFGIAHWTFWEALPVSVAVATLAGIFLGVPVLRMRGDYLAIVTLGFGEIIRILALSDLLKPKIGGAQGILSIPKPPNPVAGLPLIGGPDTLAGPEELYYLVLVAIVIGLFVTARVKDSRMGRAWMAIREDEDVAEAMGIELIRYKLLAFAIGAALSGTAGAIFAAKLGSIFPHSFQLLISINVLCLIIVGGMGSLPGVLIGALILVGMPEILREFQELRLLLFGALLVIMMLSRPEGFWPEPERRRELHAHEAAPIELGEEEAIAVPAGTD